MSLFRLPRLPFKWDALEPYMSAKTIELHHAKLHASYVSHLDAEIIGTKYQHMLLEEIVKDTSYVLSYPTPTLSREQEKKIRNIYKNSAQHYNHSFFWQCLTPENHKVPDNLNKQITKSFGSITDFKHQFTETALALFGSGWTWLVQDSMQNDRLFITNGTNADSPLINNNIPLLVCDIWEHSYLLDVGSDRKKYLENYWYIVNWEFCNSNLR